MQDHTPAQIAPIIQWAGGKRQLLPEIAKHIPQFTGTYYEPFIGGGAVAFHYGFPSTVIGDYNPELINLYTVVRDQHEELIDALGEHADNHAGEDPAGYYYQVRALDREPTYAQLPAVDKAARFIYLNKTCFNALYRVNRKGQNNVSFGSNNNPKICDAGAITRMHEYLGNNNVALRNSSYQDTVADITDQDFVYFDPPYVPLTVTASFTNYTNSEFGYVQQQELAQLCDELSDRGVRFMLSNSDTEIVRDLYSSHTIVPVLARRSINSKGTARGAVGEVLVKNF